MTPYEYAQHMDAILRYVGHLLTCAPDSIEWHIGRNFALLDDEQRFRYVQLLVGGPEGTREFEIGWDLRALLLGWPETKAVAS